MPSLAEQLISILVIAVAMLFGALLYRRHAAQGRGDASTPERKKRKARPRKKS